MMLMVREAWGDDDYLRGFYWSWTNVVNRANVNLSVILKNEYLLSFIIAQAIEYKKLSLNGFYDFF